MTYKHLSEGDRETLAYLRACGKSLREAAFFLGRSPSSLSRELKRNKTGVRYRAHVAHRLAVDRRHQTLRKKPTLNINVVLRQRIVQWLKLGWSPEIIAGELKREAQGTTVINPETIYRWIYAHDKSLVKHLLRSHPQRRPRWVRPWPKRIIPRRTSISERPAEVNLRQVPGHWETDLIVGSGQAALQVLVERKTRFVRLRKIPNKSAQASFEALSALLAPVHPSLRQTITYDNGPENVLHVHLNQRLGLRSYFCEPYHAWEKGTVENTNGLIRRFLPKRTNFDTISPLKIQKVEHWLNHRPRKCLNFQTPALAFKSAACCT